MNKIPKQALIMAGGLGSRMSPGLNPLKCKSLIKLGNQPLLGHLIDSLLQVGIKEFIFKTSKHCYSDIKQVVESKNLTNYELVEGGCGFRETPYFVKDSLDERFLFICGHQFLTTTHLQEMLTASEVSENVISIYNNKQYPMNKERRILYENESFRRVSIHEPGLLYDYHYARNPYIIQRNIADIIRNDNYAKTFSYYMFKLWEQGISMKGVYVDMPPEFDYDQEFLQVKDFFLSYKKQQDEN